MVVEARVTELVEVGFAFGDSGCEECLSKGVGAHWLPKESDACCDFRLEVPSLARRGVVVDVVEGRRIISKTVTAGKEKQGSTFVLTVSSRGSHLSSCQSKSHDTKEY